MATDSYGTPSFTQSGSLPTLLPYPSTDDYFNIDDILASQQRVPVHFEMPVYRLGFLNQSLNEEHLQPGLKMEIPFWLAKVLGSRKRQILNAHLPKCYRELQRDILSADANVVDLHKLQPYYYSMGLKLMCFEHLERQNLSRSILETFLKRFRMIMDHSQNAFRTDTYSLTCKLDETERHLFNLEQCSTTELLQWKSGTSHRLCSSLTTQTRKRIRHPSP